MQVNLVPNIYSHNFYGKSHNQNMQFRGYLGVTNAFSSNKTDSVSFSGTVRPPKLSKFNFLKFASVRLKFKNYEIPVHNSQIAPYMDETYSARSFSRLFKHADSNGVFDFNVDERTGFVKTSDIASNEDSKMADAVWVTDTCRNISLLKHKRPELCTRAVESLSTYYKKQQADMEKMIENPDFYRTNKVWNLGGVGHVFDPHTNEPNPNFLRTRLESVGQYLQRSSEMIFSGLVKGAKYGYQKASSVGDDTIESIATCVKYLKAINYPQARSCGAWEEHTFDSSLLSDTAIINEGFRRVLKLMYCKTENPEIMQIRERILNSKHGDVFKNKEALYDLLENGEERIIMSHFDEAPGERKLDATLSFVSHYEDGKLTHAKIVTKDINEHVKLLEMLEDGADSHGLVGENGIARYVNDEYKNLNYDIPAKKGVIKENHEAQWFMVSDISKGYGVQLRRLLRMLSEEGRLPTDDEKLLLDKLLAKETEYINRGYARITGSDTFKANGKDCPKYKVPEAYQAITDENGNIKYVPGTNTPLAWAQSSLFDASKMYCENLKALEKMDYFNADMQKTALAA